MTGVRQRLSTFSLALLIFPSCCCPPELSVDNIPVPLPLPYIYKASACRGEAEGKETALRRTLHATWKRNLSFAPTIRSWAGLFPATFPETQGYM